MQGKYICCICKKEFEGYGNNPDGAMSRDEFGVYSFEFKPEDRCCDQCNTDYVIPGRLYLMKYHKN